MGAYVPPGATRLRSVAAILATSPVILPQRAFRSVDDASFLEALHQSDTETWHRGEPDTLCACPGYTRFGSSASISNEGSAVSWYQRRRSLPISTTYVGAARLKM